MHYSDLTGTQMTYFSGGKITYSTYPSQELNRKSKKKLSTGQEVYIRKSLPASLESRTKAGKLD